ncbi:peptidoglycan DD-metalloendopeptidase family protein [Desulfovibrio sp. OttesenSCG-928-C06]|nr:peptidoglycan DD-metalloendopeptidase family protein [Desulfovibrio sp. OttesenSCG-928-C06]
MNKACRIIDTANNTPAPALFGGAALVRCERTYLARMHSGRTCLAHTYHHSAHQSRTHRTCAHKGYPFLARIPLILFLAAFCLAFILISPHGASAATEKEIIANLKQEESRAGERKNTLTRLTEQERALHSSLAAVEDNILKLERSLDEQRDKLRELAKSGEQVDAEYASLLAEKKKSELAMAEVLRALWELNSRRQGVGNRDLEEWTAIDREYQWSSDLLEAFDTQRAKLDEQRELLDDAVFRREALGREIEVAMVKIEEEKSAILADRIKFEQRLSTVRKQKQDAQAELNSTIKLIENLNFDLKSVRLASADIDKAKGKLAWPTKGKITRKFKPAANPPISGLGFATSSSAAVSAVHAGKVMYNDTMRGLGQVVVLQHGAAYFTVYAFLSESSVRQGQTVSRGQQLGKTGYYPAIKSNGLYFELRHHQKPVNPEPWLGPAS